MAKLTHIDPEGRARMVDVGAKAVTRREAEASCLIKLSPETLSLVRADSMVVVDLASRRRERVQVREARSETTGVR